MTAALMASGNTSVPIVSAAGGTGKEFFSGSEEKTRKRKRDEAAREARRAGQDRKARQSGGRAAVR